MKDFKCIIPFSVVDTDDNGTPLTAISIIKKGTIWTQITDCQFGKVILLAVDGSDYIEISIRVLNLHFEFIEEY